MIIKYNVNIENEAIRLNLKRIINQTYKLLPSREEGADWKKPLITIIEELAGMSDLFLDHHYIFFSLLCKLEGLFTLVSEDDFYTFRKTIFECLSLINELVQKCL